MQASLRGTLLFSPLLLETTRSSAFRCKVSNTLHSTSSLAPGHHLVCRDLADLAFDRHHTASLHHTASHYDDQAQ